MPIAINPQNTREAMSKFHHQTLAFSALCAIALASPVAAQTAGTYTGASADGQTVSFVVGLDSNSVLAVTGASVDFQAPCKGGTAPTLYSGWGFAADAVITGRKAVLVAPDPYFYITANLKFVGSTVTGTITTKTAYLDPGKTPPKLADFCESPLQAFTATLNGPGPVTPALPAGTMRHAQTGAQR
jgi:hypothetical protein